MKQALALEIMLSGENVFLTGAAGSGKTFTLNQFIKLAKNSGKKVSVTATTGLAATHLGGNTIHAWSGIGIYDYLSKKFFEKIPKTRVEIIKNTDILVIDEISMLHDFRLDMVEEICRTIRQNDKPFGGIQVILCGDFFCHQSIEMVVELVVLQFILKLGECLILRFVILRRIIARKIVN